MFKRRVVSIGILIAALFVSSLSYAIMTGTELQVTSIITNSEDTVFIGTMNHGVLRSFDRGLTFETTGLNDVQVLTLVSRSDGALFAGTGGNGIFRSENTGNTWTQITNGLSEASDVWAILFSDNATIFIGTGHGIYQSEDNGTTWQPSGLADFTVKTITTLPNGDLLAGAGTDGIYRSVDNGSTWQLTDEQTMSFDTVHVTVGPNGTVFASTWGQGMYRSLDNGDSWEQSYNWTSWEFRKVVFDRKGIPYACATRDVVRSWDNGHSWAQDWGQTFYFDNFGDIFFGKGGYIIVGLWGRGTYVSFDDGVTWRRSFQPYFEDVGIKTITTDQSNKLIVGTGNGVFRSDDNGTSSYYYGLGSKIIISTEITPGGTIFAGTAGSGLYAISDGEADWTPVMSGIDPDESIWDMYTDDSTLFAATENGVYESSDGGITWTHAGLEGKQVRSLASCSTGELFAATPNDGVFMRSSSTSTWILTNESTSDLVINKMVVNSEDTIFLATSGQNVMCSSDRGATWLHLSTPDFTPYDNLDTFIPELLLDDEGNLYATSMNRAFVSEDNGQTWADYVSISLSINRMAILPDGTIFIGVEYYHPHQIHNSGLFRSTDDGNSWTRVIPDLSKPASVKEEQPVPYTLVSYPNPFNAVTTIQYMIGEPGFVSISAYNIIGQKVDMVLEEYKNKGTYIAHWDAAEFSSGIYFIVLTGSKRHISTKTILLR